MSEPAITISQGPRANAFGVSISLLSSSPVESLCSVLNDAASGVDAWFSPATFEGGHRSNETWRGSAVLTVDADYIDSSGKHAPVPADVAQRLADAVRLGGYGCNAWHPSPRGARAFYVLDKPTHDVAEWKRAASGCCAMFAAALRRSRLDCDRSTSLAGYEVDPASIKPAQFFFTPRAVVDGVRRSATVEQIRSAPYALQDVAVPEEVKKPEPVRIRSPQLSSRFSEALERYNSDHCINFGRSASTHCPVCCEEGGCNCFGSQKGIVGRWSCFNTDHPSDVGRLSPSKDCHVGDVADLDAHDAGISVSDLLRREGYLASGAGQLQREPGCDDGDDPLQSTPAERSAASDRRAAVEASFSPGKSPASDPVISVSSALAQAKAMFRRRHDGTEKPMPLPWAGVAEILGGGLWPGAHVLTGTTAAGKSAFALQVTINSAMAGHAVLYIGLELDVEQVIARLTSMVLGEESGRVVAHWSDIYRGKVDPDTVDAAVDRLDGLPIYVEEAPPGGWSARSMRSRVEALKMAHQDAMKAPLVVLDFLQLVGPSEPGGRREELRERIGAASYAGREVARRCGAVVLMLSSISRAGASTLQDLGANNHLGSGDPSDLVGLGKESGDIEFSADSVLVLAREPRDESAPDATAAVWLAVAKHRCGRPAWSPLRFNGSWLEEETGGVQRRQEDRRAIKERAAEARRLADVERRVGRILKVVEAARSPISIPSIHAKVGGAKDTFRDILNDMEGRGLVHQVMFGRKSLGWMPGPEGAEQNASKDADSRGLTRTSPDQSAAVHNADGLAPVRGQSARGQSGESEQSETHPVGRQRTSRLSESERARLLALPDGDEYLEAMAARPAPKEDPAATAIRAAVARGDDAALPAHAFTGGGDDE